MQQQIQLRELDLSDKNPSPTFWMGGKINRNWKVLEPK
jgi:hypothetical protein